MPQSTKRRRTCSSNGGTRKQRGGWWKKLAAGAAGAATQALAIKNKVSTKIDAHLEKHPQLASGLSSAHSVAAKGLSSARTKVQGVGKVVTDTASQMMRSQHGQDIKTHMGTVHTALKKMSAATTAGAASAARTAARTALEAAIKKYKRVFGIETSDDDAILRQMETLRAHQALNPNANKGGRKKHGHKKRAHKKRHATKKRRHKKRHATKKRGHKKHRGSRKRRGGAPCPCTNA